MKATHDLLVTVGALTLASAGGPAPTTSQVLAKTPDWTKASLVRRLDLLCREGYVVKLPGTNEAPTRWRWVGGSEEMVERRGG